MSALNPHQGGKLVLAVSAFDIRNRERHCHLFGMTCGLLIHRIDQVERLLGEVSLIGLRINPDRKELRPKISALRLIQTDMPDVVRVGRANIKVLFEKALWSIGM